jgi:hypothetical protein
MKLREAFRIGSRASAPIGMMTHRVSIRGDRLSIACIMVVIDTLRELRAMRAA